MPLLCSSCTLLIQGTTRRKMKERSNSSSVLNYRIVTLKLTYKVLRDSTLVLPSAFMRANGIKKIGNIGFVGQADTNFWGYLSSTLGSLVVEIDWGNFYKFDGVKKEI